MSSLHGWGWTLLGFSGWGNLCLCSCGWSYILSFWKAVPCLVVSLGVSGGLVFLWADCLLTGLGSCFTESLAWGIWHWSLLFFGLNLALELWWRPSWKLSLINAPWGRRFLVVQSPGLRSPSLEVQAHLLTVASRFHSPHSTEDKTPRLMVKATLNSQDQPKKLTHLQRVKREKERIKKESNEVNKQTHKWTWILKTRLAKVQNQKHGKNAI